MSEKYDPDKVAQMIAPLTKHEFDKGLAIANKVQDGILRLRSHAPYKKTMGQMGREHAELSEKIFITAFAVSVTAEQTLKEIARSSKRAIRVSVGLFALSLLFAHWDKIVNLYTTFMR